MRSPEARIAWFVVLTLVAGCSAPSRAPATLPTDASAAAPDPAPAARPLAVPTNAPAPPASLTPPSFGTPGPIRIVGYPTRIQFTGNDPAHRVGFTRDGSEFGYCAANEGVGGTSCAFLNAAGEKRSFGSLQLKTDRVDEKEERNIERWLLGAGVPAVVGRGSDARGPALSGTWRFASDIVLQVTSTAGTVGDGGAAVSQPSIRFGGRVGSYPPVYPFTLATDQRVVAFYGAFPNGVALSPNGEEIGALAGWYGMEFAGDFKMIRIDAGAFAAGVYNDTAFALHKRSAFREAAELFTKATFADEAWSLAPYNLACAFARGGDVRTESALRVAIARGGAEIKKRARGDADFDSVRALPWFASVTAD